jgi:hypothetical protein
LLVGSLPADTTEDALRAGADLFGDLVPALPDGETDRDADGWDMSVNGFVVRIRTSRSFRETASPTGIPRHAYETPVFRIRKGVSKLDSSRGRA